MKVKKETDGVYRQRTETGEISAVYEPVVVLEIDAAGGFRSITRVAYSHAYHVLGLPAIMDTPGCSYITLSPVELLARLGAYATLSDDQVIDRCRYLIETDRVIKKE